MTQKLIFPLLHAQRLLLLCLLLLTAHANAQTIKIGVLAFRPTNEVSEQYNPLAKELNRAIPEYDFQIVPCNYEELERGISSGEMDFLLTNPAHYVKLATRYALSAPLATLVNKTSIDLLHFGGVIVTRADRTDLRTLTDLRGKNIVAVDEQSFGGFQAQAHEIQAIGLHWPNDYTVQFLGMPHDNVVKRVLERKADAGFIRTGVLEGMIQNGTLQPADINVLNAQRVIGFPQALSTQLFPEWPLIATANTDEKLIRHLTATVLDFAESSSASNYFFAAPSTYTAVEELLRDLRLPPFDQTPRFTVKDVWERYFWELVLSGFCGLLIVLLLIRLGRMNKKLAAKHLRLQDESRLRYGLLNTMAEGVYAIDSQGVCSIANPAAQNMLGYSEAELLGHNTHTLFHYNHINGQPYTAEECPVLQTLHDQKPRHCKEWFIRKSGEGFPVELKITPHHDSYTGQIGAIVVFHDITEQQKEEQRILHIAHHDTLTGLPNRALFDDRLAQALAISKRDGTHVGMMFVDLDKFKPVNDQFGHHMGDLLLIEVAQRLRESLRDSDTAARIGGDEFVVLLPNTQSTEDAMTVARKILDSLRAPFELTDMTIRISASLGVAVDTRHACNEMELKAMADAAMYQAKEKGRNNATLYQDDQSAHHSWTI